MLIFTGSVMFDTSLPTEDKNINGKLLFYLPMNAVEKKWYIEGSFVHKLCTNEQFREFRNESQSNSYNRIPNKAFFACTVNVTAFCERHLWSFSRTLWWAEWVCSMNPFCLSKVSVTIYIMLNIDSDFWRWCYVQTDLNRAQILWQNLLKYQCPCTQIS